MWMKAKYLYSYPVVWVSSNNFSSELVEEFWSNLQLTDKPSGGKLYYILIYLCKSDMHILL